MENKQNIINKKTGKTLRGVVVSNKMQDTIVVAVNRFIKHSTYKKYHKVTKRYKVHCPTTKVAVGDTVVIKESRPISKTKSFVFSQKVTQ